MLTNFSPNMLKTYETCPRKYYYQYVENVQVPCSALPFEKGKKIHALANYFLQGVNISRIETALTEQEYQVWQILLNNPYFRKECLKSEYSLTCKIADYWVGGRLDAVVHDGEDYYILDYKTGSVPKNPQYDFQTMVYLLCLSRYLKTYDSLSFVYINLKDNQNHVIKFSETLESEYTEILKNICGKIVSDKAYKPSENQCARCEYSRFCD